MKYSVVGGSAFICDYDAKLGSEGFPHGQEGDTARHARIGILEPYRSLSTGGMVVESAACGADPSDTEEIVEHLLSARTTGYGNTIISNDTVVQVPNSEAIPMTACRTSLSGEFPENSSSVVGNSSYLASSNVLSNNG